MCYCFDVQPSGWKFGCCKSLKDARDSAPVLDAIKRESEVVDAENLATEADGPRKRASAE
jgi:hypothetical protein